MTATESIKYGTASLADNSFSTATSLFYLLPPSSAKRLSLLTKISSDKRGLAIVSNVVLDSAFRIRRQRLLSHHEHPKLPKYL